MTGSITLQISLFPSIIFFALTKRICWRSLVWTILMVILVFTKIDVNLYLVGVNRWVYSVYFNYIDRAICDRLDRATCDTLDRVGIRLTCSWDPGIENFLLRSTGRGKPYTAKQVHLFHFLSDCRLTCRVQRSIGERARSTLNFLTTNAVGLRYLELVHSYLFH